MVQVLAKSVASRVHPVGCSNNGITADRKIRENLTQIACFTLQNPKLGNLQLMQAP